MKKFQEQFNKQANHIKLSSAEQHDLRDRLVTYMEYHPMPKKHGVPTTNHAPLSVSQESGWRWSFGSWYARTAVGSSLVLVLLFVPMLAERSMPGDILYSVKVGFNEEVRSSIARSPYQRIEWETERINRRLVEAQVLAREGRLTEEREERVAEAVRTHSNSARASIERLRAENEDDAAMAEIALSALFDVHAAVLLAHETSKTELATADISLDAEISDRQGERRSRLVDAIETSRSVASNASVNGSPSYQGLLNRIELETVRAHKLLTEVADIASEEALLSVDRRLEDVERRVQSAIALHQSENDMEARIMLTEALTTTRKVITFLTTIEVRNSIDINILVPIEYTADELIEQLQYRQERLQVRFEYVETNVAEFASDEELEKALAGLGSIPAQFTKATTALAEEDFAEAGVALAEIEAILDDIVQMVDMPDRLPPANLGVASTTDKIEVATSSPSGTTATSGTESSEIDVADQSAVDETPEEVPSDSEVD